MTHTAEPMDDTALDAAVELMENCAEILFARRELKCSEDIACGVRAIGQLRAERDALRAALQAVYDVRSDVQNIANRLGERYATSDTVNRYVAAFEQARAALKGAK